MGTLFVRDMPDSLLERFKRYAQKQHRSVPAETVHLIEQALEQDDIQQQRRQAMESITRRLREKAPLPIDSLTLLREDRER
jgi:plasmid stability protein